MSLRFVDASRQRPRRALTMIEITLAVGLLAAAILPVLTLTMRSTQQTYAMEQHIMASQFAAGILDRYLAMPFKVCADAIRRESYPQKVYETETFKDAIETGESFSEALQHTFRDFEYEVTVSEPSSAGERGEMFKITVTVSWPGNPGAPPARQFSLNAVKFNENP